MIAVEKGRALDFGFAIAAVADMTLAADTAQFQIPEFAHSIMLTMVMSAIVDRVPLKAMMQHVYDTEPFSPERALTIGAISSIAPAAELDDALDAMVRCMVKRMLAAPPPASFAVTACPQRPAGRQQQGGRIRSGVRRGSQHIERNTEGLGRVRRRLVGRYRAGGQAVEAESCADVPQTARQMSFLVALAVGRTTVPRRLFIRCDEPGAPVGRLITKWSAMIRLRVRNFQALRDAPYEGLHSTIRHRRPHSEA